MNGVMCRGIILGGSAMNEKFGIWVLVCVGVLRPSKQQGDVKPVS